MTNVTVTLKLKLTGPNAPNIAAAIGEYIAEYGENVTDYIFDGQGWSFDSETEGWLDESATKVEEINE